MTNLFDATRLNELIKTACKHLKKYKNHFDAIAVQGVSGLIPGSIISHKLSKPLVMVRTQEFKSRHSQAVVEYKKPLPPRYIILDDFIVQGTNIKNILKKIQEENISLDDCECVGIYLHSCSQMKEPLLVDIKEALRNEFIAGDFLVGTNKLGFFRYPTQ